MLNLLRVETGGLLRSKLFWITVLVYVIAITSTFIPLSYGTTFSDGFTGDLEEFLQDWGIPEDDVRIVIDTLPPQLDDVDDVLLGFHQSDNFIEQFHLNSSGQFAAVLIIGILLGFTRYYRGAVKNTLLCGYSRRQIYIAKLASLYLAGCLFLLISMVVVALLGVLFYDMQMNGKILASTLLTLFGQCVVLLEYLAVFTALAFSSGIGWTILGTLLTFTLLPGLGFLLDLVFHSGNSFFYSIMPTMIFTGNTLLPALYQLLALPAAWSPGLIAGSLTITLLVSAVSTTWGLWRFGRKQF